MPRRGVEPAGRCHGAVGRHFFFFFFFFPSPWGRGRVGRQTSGAVPGERTISAAAVVTCRGGLTPGEWCRGGGSLSRERCRWFGDTVGGAAGPGGGVNRGKVFCDLKNYMYAVVVKWTE